LTGVQFDGVGPQLLGHVDLAGIGVEKEADRDPFFAEAGHHGRSPVAVRGDVQAPFGRHFRSVLGNERHLVRSHIAGNSANIVLAGHFQVQLHRDRFTENPQVAVLNMAAIFAEMQRYAVGPAELGERGGPNRVGFVGAAGLSNRRDMVDIDAEMCHGLLAAAEGNRDSIGVKIRGQAAVTPRPKEDIWS